MVFQILMERAAEWTKMGNELSAMGLWAEATACHMKAKCCAEVAKIAERLEVD